MQLNIFQRELSSRPVQQLCLFGRRMPLLRLNRVFVAQQIDVLLHIESVTKHECPLQEAPIRQS